MAKKTPTFPLKFQSYGALAPSWDVYLLLAKYDWDISTAYAIMMAESGGNPNAINWADKHKSCSGSFGLFQLACFRGTAEQLLNPETNVRMAYELYLQKGWKPWTTYLNESFRKFLTYAPTY